MLKSLYGAAVVTVCLGISAMNQTPQEFSGAPETSKPEMRRVPLSELERISLLSSRKELENYYSTWNETLSLEDNLAQLCQRFLDTCCRILPENSHLSIVGKSGRLAHRYNGASQAKIDLFLNTLYQMSHNPVGCKLIRLLLTKYLSDTTASRFSKAYIVSTNTKGKFRFGHASTATHNMCVIPVSDLPDDKSSMFAGIDGKQAQEIMEKGGSINQIGGFPHMFFFNDNIEHYDDVSLFGAMLRWFHHVSGMNIKSLEGSADAILKRHAQAKNKEFRPFCSEVSALLSDPKAYKSALVSHFSDDYFFRCMFGLVYDKASDSMKMDPLNESAYTLVKNGMIRVSFCSDSNEADVDFIGLFGDRELLEFYLTGQAKLPAFGVGQYKYTH